MKTLTDFYEEIWAFFTAPYRAVQDATKGWFVTAETTVKKDASTVEADVSKAKAEATKVEGAVSGIILDAKTGVTNVFDTKKGA